MPSPDEVVCERVDCDEPAEYIKWIELRSGEYWSCYRCHDHALEEDEFGVHIRPFKWEEWPPADRVVDPFDMEGKDG